MVSTTSQGLDLPAPALGEQLVALWRRRLVVVAVTGLAVVVALAVSLAQDTRYRASATIVIVEGQSLPRPVPRTTTQPYTETLARLLRSEALAANVVQDLRLGETPRELLRRVSVWA